MATLSKPPNWTRTASPWHAGEVAAQERVGAREYAERVGPIAIRGAMPDQHRAFFASLPFLILGARDRQGRPAAAIVAGVPGFARSPDPQTLRVTVALPAGHPLDGLLVAGAPVGVLGIQPATRRRNRMNGRIAGVDGDDVSIAVDQSFGNCPKYIRARSVAYVGTTGVLAPVLRPEGALLSDQAAALVRAADTFYIATASPGAGGDDPAEGVDVSHRGGRPGFVDVRTENGRTVLVVPDFSGNLFFNTLGNVLRNPATGLLFVDHDTGDVLMLAGTAEVIWDADEVARFAGAERLFRITVDDGIAIQGGSPLRWMPGEAAPQLAATGAWTDAKG